MGIISHFASDLAPLKPYLQHIDPHTGPLALIALRVRLFPIMRHALEMLPKGNAEGEAPLTKRGLRQAQNFINLSHLLHRLSSDDYHEFNGNLTNATVALSPHTWEKKENDPASKPTWESTPSRLFRKLSPYLEGSHRINESNCRTILQWFREEISKANSSSGHIRGYRFTRQDLQSIKFQRHILDHPSVIIAKKHAENYAKVRPELTRMQRGGANSTVRIKQNFNLELGDGQTIKTTPELVRKSEDTKAACENAFSMIQTFLNELMTAKYNVRNVIDSGLTPYFDEHQFLRILKRKLDPTPYKEMKSYVRIYVNYRKKFDDLVFFYKQRIEPDGTLAYFKQDKDSGNSTSIMELLIYRLSRYFGLNHIFTPTLLVTLKTTGGNLHSGSVQPAIQGKPLAAYQEREIGKIKNVENLLVSYFATLLFCPWDLTPHNLFLTGSDNDDKKKIVFFDNSRSLPPSNYFLQWGQNPENLLTSYRSAILHLPQSHSPLQMEHYEELKRHVADFKEKFRTIGEFLNFTPIKQLIDGLPPGWFPQKAILEAMESRMSALEAALDEPEKHKTLLDITCAVFPSFRIFLGFSLLRSVAREGIRTKVIDRHLEKPEHLKRLIARVSGYLNFLDKLLEACLHADIPPENILEVCQDISLSPEEMARRILIIYKDSVEKVRIPKFGERSITALIQSLHRDDTFWDFKDIPPAKCIKGFRMAITEAFERIETPLHSLQKDALSALEDEKIAAYQILLEREALADLHVLAKQRDGKVKKYTLDYLTYPGKYYLPEVHVNPIGLQEMLNKIRERT